MLISKKNSLFILFLLVASSTNLCAQNSTWFSLIKKFFTSLTSSKTFKRPTFNKRWVGIGALAIGSYVAWKYFKKPGTSTPMKNDDDIAKFEKEMNELGTSKVIWKKIEDTNIINSDRNINQGQKNDSITSDQENQGKKEESPTTGVNQDNINSQDQDVIHLKPEPPHYDSDEEQLKTNMQTVASDQSEKIKQMPIESEDQSLIKGNSDTVNKLDEQRIPETAKFEPEETPVSEKKAQTKYNFIIGNIVQIINNASMRMTPEDYKFYKQATITAKLPAKEDPDFKDGYINSIGIIREINDNDTVTVEVRSIEKNEKTNKLEPKDYSRHFTVLPTDIIKLNLNKIRVKLNKQKVPSSSNLKPNTLVKIAMTINIKVVEKQLGIKVNVPSGQKLPENMIGIVSKVKNDTQKAQVCYYPHWLAASLLNETKTKCESFDFKDLNIIDIPKKLK